MISPTVTKLGAEISLLTNFSKVKVKVQGQGQNRRTESHPLVVTHPWFNTSSQK